MRRLLKQYQVVVWWATPVEMRSAFERLLRMGELTDTEHAVARARMAKLRLGWREIQPSEVLRIQAEDFLTIYPLKAADALQLAAALIWSMDAPQSCTFISGDTQMLEAARQVGFRVVAA